MTPPPWSEAEMGLPRNFFSWAVSFSLLISASACSILGPEKDEIRILNETDGSIVVLAMELQASHLFDPSPSIQLDPDDARILSSGASKSLRPRDVLGGYDTGDDVRFFLYEVLGETAHFRSTLTMTGRELQEADHRVSIGGFIP